MVSILKNYEVIDSQCNWIHFNNQDDNKKNKENFREKHKVLVKYCKIHPYGFRDNWCHEAIQPGLSEQQFFQGVDINQIKTNMELLLNHTKMFEYWVL